MNHYNSGLGDVRIITLLSLKRFSLTGVQKPILDRCDFKYYINDIFKPGLYVYGALDAQGTEEDSIYFLSELPDPGEWEWDGIIIQNQNIDTLKISYCVINNALYGIFCDSVNWLSIEHCRFELNQCSVNLEYCSSEITNSIFCQTYGILAQHCDELLIQNNVFMELGENNGVVVQYSNLEAINNCFEGGWKSIGIEYYSYAKACGNIIIDAKLGFWIVNGSSADIYNNTIVGYTENAEDGIYYGYADSASIINNIITGFDYGIKVNNNETPNIAYNDVYGNSIADFFGASPELGLLAATNTNGDSCDIFFNISAEPLFVGGEPFDYNLSELSPCVEAGTDVGLPFFGNYPDIGAFESIYTGVSKYSMNLPSEFKLYQNYPNPFNAQTVIPFTLDRAGKVELMIFDILGRSVGAFRETPLQTWYPAGTHQVVWDAERVSSGVYFVRLQQQSAGILLHTQTRKVLLMK